MNRRFLRNPLSQFHWNSPHHVWPWNEECSWIRNENPHWMESFNWKVGALVLGTAEIAWTMISLLISFSYSGPLPIRPMVLWFIVLMRKMNFKARTRLNEWWELRTYGSSISSWRSSRSMRRLRAPSHWRRRRWRPSLMRLQRRRRWWPSLMRLSWTSVAQRACWGIVDLLLNGDDFYPLG